MWILRQDFSCCIYFSDSQRPTAPLPATAAAPATAQWRTMDCVDCHNRPTHVYDASPESAVDQALTHVWGYGVGLDMTRRDLQGEAKKMGRP